jgi:hypothetical protein
MQFKMEESFSAGKFAMVTVGEPGAQGATVFGTHGMGVSTPKAAAVAEATTGLAKDWHIPKGIMFAIGLKSIMFAIGMEVTVLFCGVTCIVPGAIPKLHCSIAPPHTHFPMYLLTLFQKYHAKHLARCYTKLYTKHHTKRHTKSHTKRFTPDVAPDATPSIMPRQASCQASH